MAILGRCKLSVDHDLLDQLFQNHANQHEGGPLSARRFPAGLSEGPLTPATMPNQLIALVANSTPNEHPSHRFGIVRDSA